MFQIVMKIGTYINFGIKITNFLFSRKSDKRVKSYDPVNFRVDATTRIVQTAIPGQFSGRRDDPYCSNRCSSKTTPSRDFILVSFSHKLKGLSKYIK